MDKKTIIFMVLLPLFLILFSYKVNLTFTDYDENQQNTIDFLNNKEELRLNYTQAELSHLDDVKQVMGWTDIIFYVLLLACSLLITLDKTKLKEMLFYGGISTAALLGVLLLTTLISFNFIFTLFHQIFFPQGNWIFAEASLLIQTFPQTFFISMAWKIFLLPLVVAIFFILSKYFIKNEVKFAGP